jgi:hypothetical protein
MVNLIFIESKLFIVKPIFLKNNSGIIGSSYKFYFNKLFQIFFFIKKKGIQMKQAKHT